MIPAKDVADYFLALVCPDEGDNMTHLKLQKLLYYAQGFHLAIHGEPLFEEPIFAWPHGPVVPAIYDVFKAYGSTPLPCPEEWDEERVPIEVADLLVEIYDVFGRYTASTLRNMTHGEPPWLEAPENGLITHDALRTYFSTRIVDA